MKKNFFPKYNTDKLTAHKYMHLIVDKPRAPSPLDVDHHPTKGCICESYILRKVFVTATLTFL